MTYAIATERQALLNGLSELVAFLENNPEIPVPNNFDLLVFPSYDSDDKNRSGIDVIASHIGSGIEISPIHHHYMTSRKFGPVRYRAIAIPSDENKEQ